MASTAPFETGSSAPRSRLSRRFGRRSWATISIWTTAGVTYTIFDNFGRLREVRQGHDLVERPSINMTHHDKPDQRNQDADKRLTLYRQQEIGLALRFRWSEKQLHLSPRPKDFQQGVTTTSALR
jgi:hypothetical protein